MCVCVCVCVRVLTMTSSIKWNDRRIPKENVEII